MVDMIFRGEVLNGSAKIKIVLVTGMGITLVFGGQCRLPTSSARCVNSIVSERFYIENGELKHLFKPLSKPRTRNTP
jgi:hypothetical protein